MKFDTHYRHTLQTHYRHTHYRHTLQTHTTDTHYRHTLQTHYRHTLQTHTLQTNTTDTHTTDTFLFISHTMNVLLFKFRWNILIGVRIIKEMPGSVASGTLCINTTEIYCRFICKYWAIFSLFFSLQNLLYFNCLRKAPLTALLDFSWVPKLVRYEGEYVNTCNSATN